MNTTRASLLARLKDRDDSQAWTEFDRIYRPILYRFAHACGVHGAAADDVVQDGMAAVLANIERFEHRPGKGRFRRWLRTIVQNRMANLRRAQREVQGDSREMLRLLDPAPTPEAAFEQIWMEEHLRYCIEAIRSEIETGTFAAFEMHVLREHPVEAVCRALNMSANQVHNIKWRVSQRIAEMMKELDF